MRKKVQQTCVSWPNSVQHCGAILLQSFQKTSHPPPMLPNLPESRIFEDLDGGTKHFIKIALKRPCQRRSTRRTYQTHQRTAEKTRVQSQQLGLNKKNRPANLFEGIADTILRSWHSLFTDFCLGRRAFVSISPAPLP